MEAVGGAGFSGLWEKFEEYLLSRDMSEDTIETYKRTLYEYLYWASEAPFNKQRTRTAFLTPKGSKESNPPATLNDSHLVHSSC